MPGLPPGYLNRLEQRLAETESALYGALITLRSMGPTRVAHASTRPDAVPKQKAARMEEWSQLPLQVSSGMDRWLAVMSNQFTIEPSLDMPPHGVSGSDYSMPKPLGHSNTPGDARGPPAPSVWTAREGNSAESPYEAHRYAQTIVPSPLYSDTQALVGSNGVASPSIGSGMSEHGVPEEGTVEIHQSTKAEQLTNNHPSIYF
ncbi:hypothetical protein NUU61_001017 [Penicillium alfredii]|uniref:Uncharacterized protein n=1 Tax=Penicillium alfredii TaxID=1506179 RepID=A0A9W9KRL4_9EURO|nr:uncharacterized protein NUU61_001017 [Penicillium alfredii]KAJ5115258.1 hypothetical protein NUU61_001017 [Penicillium alfredii]